MRLFFVEFVLLILPCCLIGSVFGRYGGAGEHEGNGVRWGNQLQQDVSYRYDENFFILLKTLVPIDFMFRLISSVIHVGKAIIDFHRYQSADYKLLAIPSLQNFFLVCSYFQFFSRLQRKI